MNLREAAQQALEALEDIFGKNKIDVGAITALRAALAEDAMQRLADEQQMIERGTKAWAGVPDATAWVEELRGNKPTLTSNGMPVVEGPLSKAQRTGQESRQVEPVAYCTLEQLAYLKLTVPSDDKIAIYTALPKRNPLTDEEIEDLANEFLDWNESGIAEFARAIEQAHGIGGEE